MSLARTGQVPQATDDRGPFNGATGRVTSKRRRQFKTDLENLKDLLEA